MVSATRDKQAAACTSKRFADAGLRWDFGGDTIIVSYIPIFKPPQCHLLIASCLITLLIQNTNKHIRLTQDRQSETGWLWSRMPIRVNNYQIEVEFKVCLLDSITPMPAY
jgi:hypothetical protein